MDTPETPNRTEAAANGDEGAPSGPIIFASARRGADDFTGRDRVLQEIFGWIDDPKSERVMLLLAEPGWGKSSLCAWMIGRGREPATLTDQGRRARLMHAWSASYLCSATSGSTINPTTFSRSIAEQLASRFADFAAALVRRAAPGQITGTVKANVISGGQAFGVRIATEQININALKAADVYELSVRLPLADIAAASPDRIFLLVDGLDDSFLFGSPSIVDLLKTSTDLPERVRLFLTSRRDNRVLRAFPPSKDVRILLVSDEAHKADNDQDVRDYIASRAAEPAILSWATSTGLERAAFVDQLVGKAAGNLLFIRFVLDNPPSGGVLGAAVPDGLQTAYDGFLETIFPSAGAYGANAWTDIGKPVLGALTVAVPAAPEDALPRWLGGTSGINQALETVGQLTERIKDEDGGSRRLYHPSLGDFLSTEQREVAGEPQGNRFFVEPRVRHKKITDYYLTAIKTEWKNDWGKCDRYGLRRLVPHLYALCRLTAGRQERAELAEALCDLALDEGFQKAQRAVLGDGSATIEAIRLALEVCVETGDAVSISKRAHRVAESWEPQMRASAARAIAELGTTDPKAALDAAKALL